MPKVIKDLKNNILSVSKDELFNKGYKELNMRNIAKRTNTAVGTIYNYFNSKEILVASIILEDWYKSTDEIKSVTDRALSIEEGLKGIKPFHRSIVCMVVYFKILDYLILKLLIQINMKCWIKQ